MKTVATGVLLALGLTWASGVWAAPASAVQAPASPSHTDPVSAAINELGERMLTIALDAVTEVGTFYPFAMQVNELDEAQLIGYRGDVDKRPQDSEWAQALLRELRQRAQTQRSIKLMGLARMGEVPGAAGADPVPGIWVLVDHRQRGPVVLFLPFVLNAETGKRSPSELIYYAPEQGLFPR